MWDTKWYKRLAIFCIFTFCHFLFEIPFNFSQIYTLIPLNFLWRNWTSHNLSSYGKVTLVTWQQSSSSDTPPPPVHLPGEAQWRYCWVNSPSCTFIVLSTGLKLSCWFVSYEAVESLCSDTALLSYSWWFSFMLLAFCSC